MSPRAPRTRCTVADCPNYARPGADRCTRHRYTLPEDAANEFRERMESGNYADLLGERMARMVAEAAQVDGLDNEIGALRMVMTHLLATEADPLRLATSIPKLTAAIVQVMRAQRLMSDQQAESITDAIATIVEELTPQ